LQQEFFMAQSRHHIFKQFAASEWKGFCKGVEKEGLRADASGFIAQTPHPHALGSALTHPRITTDYSESLLELITPVYDTTAGMLEALGHTHQFVQRNLGDEVFWASSMPCGLDGDGSIPIANYGSSNVGKMKHVYRQGLAVRYGRMMQSIAGTHYNVSLPEGFWPQWQQAVGGDELSLQDFKSEQYFWLIRNFRRRSWLLMLLFGASPALDQSFVANVRHNLSSFNANTFFGEQASSLRMGDLGYHNNAQSSLNICFNELKTYTHTLEQAIHTPWLPYEKLGINRDGEYIQLNTNVLQIENEYYSALRPKRAVASGEKPIHALMSRGVEYIEVRCLDLDPFSAVGITASQVDFLDLFLLDCLLQDSPRIGDDECVRLDNNFKDIVARGRGRDLALQLGNRSVNAGETALELLDSLQPLAEQLDGWNGDTTYVQALAEQRHKFDGSWCLPSQQVLDAMVSSGLGHRDWALEMSLQHKRSLLAQPLSEAVQQQYKAFSLESLQQQQQIEAADTLSFADYLRQYQQS
jgi:glutamate--cysteine ligase